MRSFLKIQKNTVTGLIFASIFIISLGIFIQSCSNEEDDIISDETNAIQNTDEYVDYIQAMSSFKDEVFEALNSMSVTDRNFFLENINDDEVITSFLEKYDLSNSNIILQESAFQFINNTYFDNLDEYGKEELFMTAPSNIDQYATIPRLRSGDEIGTDPCYVAYIEDISVENALVSLKLLGCTCSLEIPVAACLCYTIIVAEHYIRLNDIEEEYQNCLNNK